MEPGDRFGRLMVVGPAESAGWLLLCDCGLYTTATGPTLRSGARTECLDCTDWREGDRVQREEAAS